jgi:hypothetical protein
MHTRFLAQGRVSLDGSRIAGTLNCNGGRFDNRGAVALSTADAVVGRDLLLGVEFHADGAVHLDRSRIGGILDTNDALCDVLTTRDVQAGSSSRSRE